MMEGPGRVYWRPVSAARRDLVPVLVWDGYIFRIGCPGEDGVFRDQTLDEEIYALCWADIPDPPTLVPQRGPQD